MSNSISFQVRFKSDLVDFHQWSHDATIEQVKQHLEEQTGVPKDGQKLLCKGKVLKDDSALLHQVITEGSKVIMMGSLPAQIEKVNLMDKKVQDQRQLAPSLRLKKKQLYQKRGPDPNAKYTFHKISVIDEFPHPEKARELLERLRDDRGIKAIMADRKWSVGELIELTPFEKTILGYNRNAGQLIALRLRTDDLSGFRHYDSVRKVLLHELTHNVWGDHDDNFHALNRQLNKDVVALDWSAHGGHSLGGGSFYNPEDEDEEDMESDITYEAGAYRLGSSSGSKINSTVQQSTPEARRQQLAQAALSRLTKQEEQEMDEGCGSAKH